MSWTYSGNPASSDKDAVRFYVGDVDANFPFLTDEEISYLIEVYNESYSSPVLVAAVAADTIANRFAREVSVSADGVSVQLGELQQRFTDLAKSLRGQHVALYGAFELITLENLLSNDWDPDIKPLVFGVGFNDNYMAGRQNYGDFHPGRTTTWQNDTGQNEPIVWG
ncbi:hypothetical protein UFOVP1264_8 [uncultured Caudovirales phage]|uniref:Uncharacterized protein n=1 Tax=uncultured Caudovirales phage TaxID=2100421 RepID=A0A6J5RBI5_9CAUD|nr:hypothetical protein UFOVP1264_8 [uncultured Caudovirales phage]